MSRSILFILGPNLNMVGQREKNIYGAETAETINEDVRRWAEELGFEIEIFQSNGEGEIISKIHSALGTKDGIIINAGAYTHYSYARHKTVIGAVCRGQISGFGKFSYKLALQALSNIFESEAAENE